MSKAQLYFILLTFVLTSQCRAVDSPPSPPAGEPPTPVVQRFPPIEPGDGSDLIDHLLERGVLRVGIWVWPAAEFSPPAFRGFSNAATGGALNGFEVDVARLLAEGLGLELELVEAYPPIINSGAWPETWDIALASLVPFDQIERGHRQISYSRPYGYMPLGFVGPAGPDEPEPIEQLANRPIAVLEHSAAQRLLANAGQSRLTVQNRPLLNIDLPPIRIIPVSNLPKAIQRLAGDDGSPEYTAIFGPVPIFQEAIKRNLPLEFATSPEVIGVQPLVVGTVPRDGLKVDRLLLEINAILDWAHRRGVLAEIYLRWYGQDLSQPPSIEN